MIGLKASLDQSCRSSIKINLFGVEPMPENTPESLAALRALEGIVKDQRVICMDPPWRSARPTLIAICSVKDKDVAAEMLRGGYLLPRSEATLGQLQAALEAQQQQRGVWQSSETILPQIRELR